METPLIIRGTVIHGNHLGATLGFPTANIDPDPAMPPGTVPGVYAVTVDHEGVQLKGMANIGTRPTIGGTSLSFEVHLFDFTGDLYGKILTVKLVTRIRDERKFGSLPELTAQLHTDKSTASALLSRLL